MKKLILLSILLSVGCEEPKTEGCPNPAACNYSAIDNINDGSCYYGSMTMTADSVFNNDCLYTNSNTCNYNCEDSCIVELDCVPDCAGVWGGDSVEDECGECGGNGFIPEGACDCEGGLPDEDDVVLWGKCYPISTTTAIDLSNHQLTNTIPASICNLTNLVSLDLRFNELSDSIPNDIGNLTFLKELFLTNNSLSGSIPASICNLTNLVSLDLRFNELSGSIPNDIGNLTFLKELFLTNNSLSGSIPANIGDLTNLRALTIGNNQLTGEIPTSLYNLNNLEELWLWGNQLSGQLSDDIVNLNKLDILDLSDNHFSGTIPESICEELSLIIWRSYWDGVYTNRGFLYNNNFCPEYPLCIEDHIGTQDTSHCP